MSQRKRVTKDSGLTRRSSGELIEAYARQLCGTIGIYAGEPTVSLACELPDELRDAVSELARMFDSSLPESAA